MDFGSLADKAKGLAAAHDDQVDAAIDKLGDIAKEKFAGHDEQIDKAVEFGQNYDFGGGEGAPEADSGAPAAPSADAQ